MSPRLYRGALPSLFACLFASSCLVAAQPGIGPYAGEQTRAIKSLSDEERSALLAGHGSGFAKAAELNGYPGPTHTLELAAELALDSTQRAATQALMAGHRRRAREMGAELVAAEAELDALFADRRARVASVASATRKVGFAQARLRAEHLKAHLLQTALLTPAQVERYAVLRGYRSSAATPPVAEHQRDGTHRHR